MLRMLAIDAAKRSNEKTGARGEKGKAAKIMGKNHPAKVIEMMNQRIRDQEVKSQLATVHQGQEKTQPARITMGLIYQGKFAK